MIRSEPIIAVADVQKSSAWYQELLHCKSNHGGTVFEILTDENGEHILSLHKWGAHEHPTFMSPENAGNGLILYFLVEDLDRVWGNAQKLNAVIEEEPHLNTNSRRMEFSLRDPDHYYISICTDKK